MRIDRIVLNNFISHQSTDTPFYDGITMIIGHNGAGKSSIIDAIVFALFGPKGEYVRGKKAEDLIKKGNMFASVELHFSMGENRYTVFRRVSMKKSDTAAYLEMNGNRIIDTISGVDQEIESILGVSKEIFMNSVFVKQGEMDSLIDEDPAKRKELFGKLIGIDRLTRSSKTVGDLVKDLEYEKAILQESVKNIEPLKESLKEAEGQKKVQSENLVVISSDLAEARKFLSSVEEKRTIILGKQSELNSARQDLERINSEITATEDKLKRTMIEISRLEGLLKAQETLANDPLLVNRESISRYFVIQGRFQSTRKELEKARKDKQDILEIKGKIAALQKDHEEFLRISSDVERIKVEVQKREGIKEDFNHYSRQLEEAKKELETQAAMKAELGKILERIVETPENLKDISMIEEIRSRATRRVFEKMSAITQEEHSIGDARTRLEELEKNSKMIEGRSVCPVCNSNLDAEHYHKLKSEYEQKDQEYRLNIEESEKKLKTLNSELAELKKYESAVKSRKLDDFAALLSGIEKNHNNVENLQKRINLISGDYGEYLKFKNELEIASQDLKKLGVSEQGYSTYQGMLKRYDPEDLDRTIAADENEVKSMEEETMAIEKTVGFRPPENALEKIMEIDAKYRRFDQLRQQLAAEKSTEKGIIDNLGTLRERLSEKTAKIDSLKNIPIDLQKIENVRKSASVSVDELIGRESAIKTGISNLTKTIGDRTADLAVLEESEKRYTKVSAAVIKLARIRDAFGKDGVQEIMRKDSAERITNRARSYVSSFGLNIDDMKIDENFDISVTQNGMEQSLNTLSGGEKTSLAIAVRLSIARYLTGTISTIIMDEPTTYLDEERRKDLKDIIQYSLQNENLVPQTIIITHHSDLAAVADTSYEVTNRGGNSVIKEMV